MEVALLTGNVLTVHAVPVSQIQQVLDAMILNIRPDYVRGFIPNYASVAQVSNPATAHPTSDLYTESNTGPMLVILNLPTLLADQHLIIDEEL